MLQTELGMLAVNAVQSIVWAACKRSATYWVNICGDTNDKRSTRSTVIGDACEYKSTADAVSTGWWN
jgi:hypothetical protein